MTKAQLMTLKVGDPIGFTDPGLPDDQMGHGVVHEVCEDHVHVLWDDGLESHFRFHSAESDPRVRHLYRDGPYK